MYKFFLKRVCDCTAALVGIVLFCPLLFLITIGLFVANQGQPFFFQTRPGRNEKLFRIVKFKTMNDKMDAGGHLLSDTERLTPIGAWVRRTSLDELPQLFNVLIGDMSLIGPRPLLPQYLPLYNQQQKKRHDVRPGITGWAQVNGRNAISWKQKFEYDVWYVEHLSISIDIKVLYLTIKKVIQKEGITMQGQATTEAFKGN
jgi:undecaprenyl phosphate N,N'-diacetylbacillosamine 1-phosphate transferase